MDERIEELKLQIKELLEDKKYFDIRELLVDMNEADIAEIIESFDEKTDVVRIFRLLPKDNAAEVFSYIPVEYEQMIIESITTREINFIMNELFTDDVSNSAEELVDPETLEEPDYEMYEDKDEYARAYDAYKEEYLKLKEDWHEIDKKNEIRKAFEEIPFEITTYELYVLKDNTPVKIADNLKNVMKTFE